MLKLTVIGRVGKDPETREVGNSKVTKFTVAHSERYKNKQGETVENTAWVNVEGWEKTGEILAQYVKKGDQIYIEGMPKAEAWKDKEGEVKGGLAVRVDKFEFLGSKAKPEGATEATTTPVATTAADSDGELPF